MPANARVGNARVILSKRAREDLIALGHWITEQADGATAIGYVRRIRAKCDDLADFPNRGTLRPEYGGEVRSIPYDSRLILYRVDVRETTILRVIHGSRDIRSVWLD